jgi:phosphatidate cytidylyltransferase
MQRVVSGAAMAAAALALVLFASPLALRLAACGVAVLAADEYLRMVARGGPARRAQWLALTALAAWVMAAPTERAVFWVFGLTLVGMAVERRYGGRPGWTALAPWYVGAPLGLLAGLHALAGPVATLVLLATVVVSDTGQYYVRRALGRTPLAPRISPRKTVEGAVGGVVLTAIFLSLAGAAVLPGAGRGALAALAVLVAVLGIGGDLYESSLKRAAGVKDSSSLIPGHGGVLDRIDALLFAIPALFLYVRTLA